MKGPWGDIVYKNLQPQSLPEAIQREFCPCMIRGPQPENADPSSLLWCRPLFKHNYQFAKDSAAKNKKALGLDFNPGPSSPRDDGVGERSRNSKIFLRNTKIYLWRDQQRVERGVHLHTLVDR